MTEDRPRSVYILTLNRRFMPSTVASDYGMGVVGFSFALATELMRREQFGGFVLYQRDESIIRPFLVSGDMLGFPAVELAFNFNQNHSEVTQCFRTAVRALDRKTIHGAVPHGSRTIVYHQTNTLLPFHPREYAFIVTHHGPFADEVCREFGEQFAINAFQGGRDKFLHLRKAQALGLRVLRNSQSGMSVELSNVQRAALIRSGIQETHVLRATPPLMLNPKISSINLRTMRPHATENSLTLVSAAARVDVFKNLKALIEEANQAYALGANIKLRLFVGAHADRPERDNLRQYISEGLRRHAVISSRLPHDELLRMFSADVRRTVFVCTSLYETLGITPLEAALSGMVTLVPNDTLRIGATEYIPRQCRFPMASGGLARRILELYEAGDLTDTGEGQRQYVVRQLRLNPPLTILEQAVGTIVSRGALMPFTK